MKIALVVHGRFHAFDLARELLRRGHDVVVFTNYPKWVARKFGVPPKNVRSFRRHGIAVRLYQWAGRLYRLSIPERLFHSWFGRWAAREAARHTWDIVHVWSGVAEELLEEFSDRNAVVVLMRGSAHIRVQDALLRAEAVRSGADIQTPGEWIIGREEREYRKADVILVLSGFAYKSFRDEGIPESRLRMVPLGSEVACFKPSRTEMELRRSRILGGEPLRILYVGTLSFRKGFRDLKAIARGLRGGRFHFRCVGTITREVHKSMVEFKSLVEYLPHQAQSKLPEIYAWADVFLFPTLEDGFAVVLSQAQAAALPILATQNCGGPDIIKDGQSGWILPAGNPEAFIERLHWCDANRERLVDMIEYLYTDARIRDWKDVVEDFEFMSLELMRLKKGISDTAVAHRRVAGTAHRK